MIHTYDASAENLVRAKPLPVKPTDITNIGFDANEAVSAFTATMIRLDTKEDATVGATSLVGEVGTVQISDLSDGVRYRVTGQFTRANGTKWSEDLIIDCNA